MRTEMSNNPCDPRLCRFSPHEDFPRRCLDCGLELFKSPRGRWPLRCSPCRLKVGRERFRERYADPEFRARVLERQREQKRRRYREDAAHRAAKQAAARRAKQKGAVGA